MITICHILHSLNIGGAEILAAQLGKSMAQHGFRTVYFCLDEDGTMADSLRTAGIPVEVLGRKPGLDRLCMRRMRHLWEKYHVDLVHAHQCTPFFYALGARWFQRKPPILLTEHGRFYPDAPSWKHAVFFRFMLGAQDHLVGVSQSVAEALILNEGLPRNRVKVIYNGIPDLSDNLSASDKSHVRIEVRNELHIPQDAFMVIHVARLDPIKNIPLALDAIHQLAQAQEKSKFKIHYVIVGDGPEYETIRAKVLSLSMQEYVHFTGSRNDITRLLRAADVFLLTSFSEGIPVTILEAMRAGIPVISTAVGGIPEILTHAQTGLLAPSGDVSALHRCLETLLNNPVLRKNLSDAGYELFRRRFTQEHMNTQYLECYKNMLMKNEAAHA